MPQAPRRIRRTLLTRLLSASVLLIVIGATLVGGWLRSEDFQRRAQLLLLEAIEGETGEHFYVDRVQIALVPPGIVVQEPRLQHHEDEEVIIRADKVTVPFTFRGNRPAIGTLRVDSPFLELNLDADGKLKEFQRRTAPKTKPSPLRELPWSNLDIRDGAFSLILPDGRVDITGFQIQPTGAHTGDLGFQVELAIGPFSDLADISVPGMTLGPRQIVVPEMYVQSRAATVTGHGDYTVGSEIDGVVNFHTNLADYTAFVEAPRAFRGEADIDLHLEGSPANLKVGLTGHVENLSVDTPGLLVDVVRYDLGNASVVAQISQDGLTVEKAMVDWGSLGSISAWGEINRDLQLSDGHIMAENLAFEPLLRNLDAAYTPWVGMIADVEISASGPLKPLSLDGDFDLAIADLAVASGPLLSENANMVIEMRRGHARGSLNLNPDRIVLNARKVVTPRSSGDLVADIGFKPRGPLDLRINLVSTDLRDVAPMNDLALTGRGSLAGRIWGPFNRLQFEGYGDMRDFSVAGIPYADRLITELRSPNMKSLIFENARATKGESHYSGSLAMDFKPTFTMTTDLQLTRGRAEDILGMFVDLEGITGNMTGSLKLDGPFYQMNGNADFKFSGISLYGEKFQRGVAHGTMNGGRFTLNDLRITRDQGKTGLSLRGSVVEDWKLNMELLADGFTLETMDVLDAPMAGKLTGVLQINNTLMSPEPHGRIAVYDSRYRDKPIPDSHFNLTTKDGVLHVDAGILNNGATVKGTLGLWGDQPYLFNAKLSELPVHLITPEPADGGLLEALATGKATIRGDFGETWSPVSVETRLDAVAINWSGHTLTNNQPWQLRVDGKRSEFRDINLSGGGTKLFVEGLSEEETLTLNGEGALDLDLLRMVVPGLTRSDGRMALRFGSIKSTGRPTIDVEVDGTLMRHSSVPAAFEDIRARIRATPDHIEVREVEAGLGGGEFTVQGNIRSENWAPVRYELEANVTDSQVQWVDTLPPAIGDARLVFDGPVEGLLMSGEVSISEMLFIDRINWEDWLVEFKEDLLVDSVVAPSEPWFSFDIDIDADKTIKLRNNVADGTASAQLRILGNTARPGLTGWVRMHDGTFYFQDRMFSMERANLLFHDPWSWDPDLDIDLLTDVTSRDQAYRIHYQILGPFSDWHSVARSEPDLPQADVNALLWFGVTTEDLQETGELFSAVLQGVGDLVLTDFLLSTQASEIGDDFRYFFFDRVELATGINARGEYSPDPRVLVTKRYADLADIELTGEVNLSRPGDQYYRLNKRLTNMWNLSGWYATLERDRGLLPVGGAFGVDVSARWEAP
jgi:hypothetical protein